MCVARCLKLEAGLRLQLTAPKGRPSGAQANGLSVPVKKNISSAGLVDSGPVGGEAVQNSTVVSICGDFLAARSEPPLDCVQDEL